MASQKSRAAAARSASRNRNVARAGGAARPAAAASSGSQARAGGSAKGATARARQEEPMAVAETPAHGIKGLWRRVAAYVVAHKLETATFVISVIGLGVSSYLTYEHFTSTTVAGCSDSGAINCTKVTTSQWSHLFGIPVAVLGLAFYLLAVTINSPFGWRFNRAPLTQPVIQLVRLGSVIVGMIFVLYLIWAELLKINAICLFCTYVHVCTFILFGLIVYRSTVTGLKPTPSPS